MRRLLLAALALIASPAVAGDGTGPVHVSSGRIVDLGILKSRYADPRRVVVWLPDGYKQHERKYAVLYMHDGQNLFDKATAGYGMEWEIDETLGRLIREKKVRPTIVVGIWNTPKRLQEYVPSKAFTALPADYRGRIAALYGGEPLSDGYLKFLVRELRPTIDRRFNVQHRPRQHNHHGIVDGFADLALRHRPISTGVRRRGHDVDPLALVHEAQWRFRQRA